MPSKNVTQPVEAAVLGESAFGPSEGGLRHVFALIAR